MPKTTVEQLEGKVHNLEGKFEGLCADYNGDINRINKDIVPLKKRRMTIKSLETMLKDNIKAMSKDYITLSSNDKELLHRMNEFELTLETMATAINDLDTVLMKAHKNTNSVWKHLLEEAKPSSFKVEVRYGLLRRFIFSIYNNTVKLLRWLI